MKICLTISELSQPDGNEDWSRKFTMQIIRRQVTPCTENDLVYVSAKKNSFPKGLPQIFTYTSIYGTIQDTQGLWKLVVPTGLACTFTQ